MCYAALFLSAESLPSTYGGQVLPRLRSLVSQLEIVAPGEDWRQRAAALRDAEVIFSGWGAPRMDEEFLTALPKLKAVFYAGGSVRYFTTPAFWKRGVRLTTAQAVNAIPVAEYAQAVVLLGLKRFWHYAQVTRTTRSFPVERPMPAAYGSVVGLVSYGMIARLLRKKLLAFDVEVLVYDPFLTTEEAARENVQLVDLDTLFASADVVSLHVPALPETAGLIGERQISQMKPGAVFINTARGEVVNEPALIAVLQRRPDLQAVLDVSWPEPPEADSLLYSLPNVLLTPHIAGSVGAECQRMALAMMDEFERYRAGQPLLWEITSDKAARIA